MSQSLVIGNARDTRCLGGLKEAVGDLGNVPKDLCKI